MAEGDLERVEGSKVRAGWLTTVAGRPVPFAITEGWLDCLDCGKSYDSRDNFIAHACGALEQATSTDDTDTVTGEENDA